MYLIQPKALRSYGGTFHRIVTNLQLKIVINLKKGFWTSSTESNSFKRRLHLRSRGALGRNRARRRFLLIPVFHVIQIKGPETNTDDDLWPIS